MRYCVLFAAMAAAGCRSAVEPSAEFLRGDDRLVVTTDRAAYRVGDAMGLTIVNVSGTNLQISLCPGTWEQRSGETWRRSEQLMTCSTDYLTLPAGSALEETVQVPEGLAGEHRVIVHIVPARGDVAAGTASNPFLVRAD